MSSADMQSFTNKSARATAVSPLLQNVTLVNEQRLLITDRDLFYITMVNTWGLGQCVTILGLIVNVLNAVTFVKQGMKDSVNISLLGLTISDLGSLVFHLLVNLCWTPPIMKLDLPFYPQQIMYFLVWAHILFTRITTGTTAWITFERCVCIVAPMKIKSIVTPRRTVTFIVALYVTLLAASSPLIYTTRYTWKFDPRRNRSILGVTKLPNRDELENVTFWINNLLPTFFFVLIVVCTTILVKTLRKNSKWRQMSTSTKSKDSSTRDVKVSKMVVIISAVFILCYFPGTVVFILLFIFPEMKYGGTQKNVLIAAYSFLIHLEGINASVNFFIYLAMSSKFKVALKEMCFCKVNKKQT